MGICQGTTSASTISEATVSRATAPLVQAHNSQKMDAITNTKIEVKTTTPKQPIKQKTGQEKDSLKGSSAFRIHQQVDILSKIKRGSIYTPSTARASVSSSRGLETLPVSLLALQKPLLLHPPKHHLGKAFSSRVNNYLPVPSSRKVGQVDFVSESDSDSSSLSDSDSSSSLEENDCEPQYKCLPASKTVQQTMNVHRVNRRGGSIKLRSPLKMKKQTLSQALKGANFCSSSRLAKSKQGKPVFTFPMKTQVHRSPPNRVKGFVVKKVPQSARIATLPSDKTHSRQQIPTLYSYKGLGRFANSSRVIVVQNKKE